MKQSLSQNGYGSIAGNPSSSCGSCGSCGRVTRVARVARGSGIVPQKAVPVLSLRKSSEGYAVFVLSPRRRFRYCPSAKVGVARVARVARVAHVAVWLVWLVWPVIVSP